LTESRVKKIKEQSHKEGVNPDDWDSVHKNLVIVAEWLIEYCSKMNLPIKFTSIIRPMIPGFSVSRTHEDKRAFDVSLVGWSDADARECAYRANKELVGIGAISKSTKRETVAVFEDGINAGLGRHLHFQVRRL
jgi:hypothetical protein